MPRLRKSLSAISSTVLPFHELLTSDAAAFDPARYGKLAVLAGVRDYPSRVKCATLCWHTLHAALDGSAAPVSTE